MLGLLFAGTSHAEQGMWTPDQIPALGETLRDNGLELDPQALSSLTDFPMGAVVSLGGCTGAFVSGEGLVVTNHHCARGSIQYSSTSGRNLLDEGFLADNRSAELPAAPGTRVFVTVSVLDVSDIVLGSVNASLSGRDTYQAIEASKKDLVAECERQPGHRCEVAAFFGGAQYKLIDRLELRDIRLVYAPADSVGAYGGDIDNWQWPRHTGDFAFYRAYVSPAGTPADYNPASNVPFRPAHHLKVSASGLGEGDFVMAAGYPGRTQRYARASEVQHTFGWYYPTFSNLIGQWIATIERDAPEGSEARIRYESRLQSLNNYLKNLGGQIDGANETGLLARRKQREAGLDNWVTGQPNAAAYQNAIATVDTIAAQKAAAGRRDFWYDQVRRPQLLSAARTLYRLSRERAKPNAEREPGYQNRDLALLQQSLERIERRYHPGVDREEWKLFLKGYMAQPASSRVAAFDEAMGLGERYDEGVINQILDRFYNETTLNALETRISLINASSGTLERSPDPFMQLAVAIYDTDLAREDVNEALEGRMLSARPDYMRAIVDYQAAQGQQAYPDANGTLRLTYGTVMGGVPADGLLYAPFTSLRGLMEKETGQEPFASPDALLAQIRAGTIGNYGSEAIGSVPVNFLTDLDSTGGNSGSPTLNARGELVGLLFDGTLESVNSDWDFDPVNTRTIHVDSRYMLWVMEFVDGAQSLVAEMDVVGLPERAAAAPVPDQADQTHQGGIVEAVPVPAAANADTASDVSPTPIAIEAVEASPEGQ
ncbi:MAG: S46 family peptidase [Pseudomonadota bacterium]